MQIWHVEMWIIAIIKSNCKKIHNQKNMLNCSLVARQLWCWIPQWRYDWWTLMKCVFKVLIYHPPETQHFIIIWRCCIRTWMLWGVCSPQKWKYEHSGMVDFVNFCCRWLGNHPFYQCQLKDSCRPCQRLYRSFSSIIIAPNTSSLKINLYLGIACWRRICAGHRIFYGT